MSEGRLHTGSDVLLSFFDCQILISRFDMTIHQIECFGKRQIMQFRVVLGWFAFFAICVFCHKDFKSLGRHQWRCRKKLNNQQEDTRQRIYSNDSSSIQLDNGNNEIEEANERILSSNSEISCVCGKVCKGNRDLKVINVHVFFVIEKIFYFHSKYVALQFLLSNNKI